jgi:hypothetical protein
MFQYGYTVFNILIDNIESVSNFNTFYFSTDKLREYLNRSDVNNINMDNKSTASQIIISNEKLGLDKQDYWDIVEKYDFSADKINDFIVSSIIYKNNFNLTYNDLKEVFSNNVSLYGNENLNNIMHSCFNSIDFKTQDLEFLLNLGADIDTQDSEGKTILMKTIENKEKHFLFDLIIQQKPNLFLVDKKNLNSYDYAQEFFPDFKLIYDYHKINQYTVSKKNKNRKVL